MLQALSRLDMADRRAAVKSLLRAAHLSMRCVPIWRHAGHASAHAAEDDPAALPTMALATCLPLQMAADITQQRQQGIIYRPVHATTSLNPRIQRTMLTRP